MIPLPGKLQNVGEGAGLLPAAALLAHAPVACHKVGQAKHNTQPNHNKQCDEPLHKTQKFAYFSSMNCAVLSTTAS